MRISGNCGLGMYTRRNDVPNLSTFSNTSNQMPSKPYPVFPDHLKLRSFSARGRIHPVMTPCACLYKFVAVRDMKVILAARMSYTPYNPSCNNIDRDQRSSHSHCMILASLATPGHLFRNALIKTGRKAAFREMLVPHYSFMCTFMWGSTGEHPVHCIPFDVPPVVCASPPLS